VRSERLLEEERTGGGPGGVPGALTNAPPDQAAAPEQAVADGGADGGAAPGAAAPAAPQPTTKRNQTTRNYELDREISHTRQPVGTLRKLSVAVVLRKPAPPAPAAPATPAEPAADGAPADAAAAPVAAAVPVEFTPEEIARMTQLVKDAVGFDAARGDTVTLTPATFIAPSVPEPLPALPIWQQPWVWDAGKQALGGLFVLILFFGLLRPAIRSLTAKPTMATVDKADARADGSNPQLALPAGEAGVPALPDGRSADGQPAALPQPGGSIQMPGSPHDSIDQVRTLVTQEPQMSANVIKEWVEG